MVLHAHGPVVDLGNLGLGHQLLEHHLVHAHRGAEHAGADVGDVEAVEQPLNGPVLPERAVQDREDDVLPVQPTTRHDPHFGPSWRHTPSRPTSSTVTS